MIPRASQVGQNPEEGHLEATQGTWNVELVGTLGYLEGLAF